jgi:hypothetical protein
MSNYVQLVRSRQKALDEGDTETAELIYEKIVSLLQSGKVTAEEFNEAALPY